MADSANTANASKNFNYIPYFLLLKYIRDTKNTTVQTAPTQAATHSYILFILIFPNSLVCPK